jgi:hypothetical protein
MEIYYRGTYRFMAQESADCIKVGSLVKQVGRKAVAKGVNAAGFCYTGFFLLTMKTFRAAA